MMTLKFNTELFRYEVYRENPVIRAGEPQPCFVGTCEKCEQYMKDVEVRE